jgi:DNA-binding MarR family transcriptional regulator
LSHPVNDLDDAVHQRNRLGILAVLVEVRRADFTSLRDTLALTDGNLSRHLQVLEDAGYVLVKKTFEERRPRTWVSVTTQGRNAFKSEITALQALIERVATTANRSQR